MRIGFWNWVVTQSEILLRIQVIDEEVTASHGHHWTRLVYDVNNTNKTADGRLSELEADFVHFFSTFFIHTAMSWKD